MNTLRLLVLSDGRPGHFNLSKGLIRALQYYYSVEMTWLDIRLRAGLGRAVMQRLLNRPRARLTTDRLRWFYEFATDPLPACDLIVSAGGNTLHANAWLARSLDCRNLFIGKIRALAPHCFWRILTVLPAEPQPPFLYWPIAPVPVVPEELTARRDAFVTRADLTGARLWTMLVGGDGAGYTYTAADWEDLGALLTRLTHDHACRWLVITGRRTGPVGEQQLRSLPPAVVARLSLFTADQGRHYPDFLAAGERIFVTEDSGTMITEAIYTQRPVVALRPRHAQPHAINKLFLEQFADRRLIHRAAMAEFGLPGHPLPDATAVTPPPTLRELGAALQREWCAA